MQKEMNPLADPSMVTKTAALRLNVRAWYAEPLFRDWFNSRLGQGVATWMPVNQPLQPEMLDESECEALAEILFLTVLQADILFEPVHLGDQALFDAESHRLGLAQKTLDELYTGLMSGAEAGGLDAVKCCDLAQKLSRNVLQADVFFDPDRQERRVEGQQTERERLDTAISTLDDIHSKLEAITRNADSGYCADVFVGVEPCFNGEGTDSDMPERYWNAIVDLARDAYKDAQVPSHVIVWLSTSD